MKKAIISSVLATTLSITGLSAVGGHDAHASETNIDTAKLAQQAQNHDASLNQPLHAGSYDYKFNVDGFDYHFWSNGTNFAYNFKEGHEYQQGVPQVAQSQFEQVESQAKAQSHASTQSNQVRTYQTPHKASYTQTNAVQKQPSHSATSGHTSVPSHLQAIAQRESGGNIHAINPSSGAAGKYQFLQSTWDAIAPSQWKGVSPASAPESVQDQMAVKLYNGGSGASHWVTA